MSRLANQKGITLIEVIIGTAIAAAIATGLGFAVLNLITVTERGTDQTSAIHDVKNAVYHISYDAKMAGSTDLIAADDLLLEWVDGGGNAHFSHYYLSGSELLRDNDGDIITVARFISSLEFTVSATNLNYVIVSSPGRLGVTESFSGTVFFRPTA